MPDSGTASEDYARSPTRPKINSRPPPHRGPQAAPKQPAGSCGCQRVERLSPNVPIHPERPLHTLRGERPPFKPRSHGPGLVPSGLLSLTYIQRDTEARNPMRNRVTRDDKRTPGSTIRPLRSGSMARASWKSGLSVSLADQLSSRRRAFTPPSVTQSCEIITERVHT